MAEAAAPRATPLEVSCRTDQAHDVHAGSEPLRPSERDAGSVGAHDHQPLAPSEGDTARRLLAAVYRGEPGLFAHWRFGVPADGWTMRAR
jgi:hypothetical protein